MEEQTAHGESNESPILTPMEARVLGVLMEKRRTTPDNYPMTLNALVQGCNQKTSRHPMMQLEPGEVGHTLNLLRDRGLVYSELGTRAERFGHKLAGALKLDQQEQALMCVLMLRGPQAPGELRSHATRLASFSDLAQVHDCLDLLMAREPPLVKQLPRVAGRREERFGHLLCGDIEPEHENKVAMSTSVPEADRIEALEQEVARLREQVEALWRLSGLPDQRPLEP